MNPAPVSPLSPGIPGPLALVVMGVSGSGKTTIGRLLAARLRWPFFDGDDYHLEANVAKMAAGCPLTDADRQPWLGRLHDLIQERLALGESSVVACSALKRSYRATLRAGDERVRFLHLEGDFDLILGRMRSRAGHFMKAGMLRSQFETLEPPAQAIVIAVDAPPETVVEAAIRALRSG
ncbi:MAG: gluconokinase [Truepera sp.]|nr:gluconokinase [Truepera sp.]